MTDGEPVAQTRQWLERVVIGLGLCPFAARPYTEGRIGFQVCQADGWSAIYRALLASLEDFMLADPCVKETALVLVPDGLEDFEDYLEMLALLNDAIDQAGLRGTVQVASFHPDYRFADASANDSANFTNRSPLPMFHLLREDRVALALEGHPDPKNIPARNIQRLRGLELARVQALTLDPVDGT